MSGGETARMGMALEAPKHTSCADDYSERGRRSLSGGCTAARSPAGLAVRLVGCALND
ncbi:hypothetical protein LMG28690_05309 [Paraburkholderia caffeinilytica]|nr:hypothetical protein LMG28690_05309 [Paraburkholderia caffeinilytica]